MNIQRIFAVGYSEKHIFPDVMLNVNSLIINTVRYQDIYKATI
ncbi:MAG: hypothetical protein ACI936_002384 [Paraglaciecola sp.]|jgi:hypothetical protein